LIASNEHGILQSYIDGVLSGQIVVSKAVRHAVQRHVDDIGRQSSAGFPYHFDAQLAAKTVRFFPGMLRHSIGRFAGMPFDLSPFQVFCTSMIFGWLRDADNTRRFRRDYRSLARKNGKSTWVAGESIFQAGYDVNPNRGTPEPVAQVVLAATKKDQVRKVIFAEAKRMREASPGITRKTEFVKEEIRFPKNAGEIIMVGSDKPFSGLNPHAVKLDEVHEFREFHREFYDTMLTGSGSRDQPLISIITTAGDDRSHLWREIYDYAKNVALGVVEDDTFFSFIAELDEEDDAFDESCWIKANPNLGVSVTMEYLRTQATEAKQNAVGKNRFTRYHGNRQVSSIEKVFDPEEWTACKGELSDWTTADCVCAGFDLGGYDDLSAFALVARFTVGEHEEKPLYRYEARVYGYISEKTERDLAKMPFSAFIYDGFLNKCEHPNTELKAELIEKMRHFGVQKVAFDPSNARSLSEELTQEGFVAASMGQNCTNFNEPIKDLLSTIKEKRFVHDGNPLLTWAVNNAMCIRDRQDRWMYDKRDSADKIDPCVAMTMAFRLATLEPARATGSLFIV